MTAERTVIRQRAHPHSAGAIAARARGEQIIGYVNPDPAGRGEGNWSARLHLSPDDQAALERAGVLSAIEHSPTCSNCGAAALIDPLTLPDGYILCAPCRDRQAARYAAATGRCSRCPYELAWHIDGACPTEAEARHRSGAQ